MFVNGHSRLSKVKIEKMKQFNRRCIVNSDSMYICKITVGNFCRFFCIIFINSMKRRPVLCISRASCDASVNCESIWTSSHFCYNVAELLFSNDR